MATILTSARGIYDRINQRAELRYELANMRPVAHSESAVWVRSIVSFHNGGNGDANDVYISLTLPNGRITRVQVLSHEPYSAKEDDPTGEAYAISLARLAPGAEVVLIVWGTYPGKSLRLDPMVSASFAGGIAESSDRPTSLEEFKDVGARISAGGSEMVSRLYSQMRVVYEQLGVNPPATLTIYNLDSLELGENDVRNALLVSAFIIFASWLFLPKEAAGAVTGIMLGLLLWLYTDILVGIGWLGWYVPAAAGLALVLLMMVKDRRTFFQFTLIAGSAVIAAAILGISGIDLICAIRSGDACEPIRVPAGIVVPFWYIYLQVLIVG
jgi:hypothetical protein